MGAWITGKPASGQFSLVTENAINLREVMSCKKLLRIEI